MFHSLAEASLLWRYAVTFSTSWSSNCSTAGIEYNLHSIYNIGDRSNVAPTFTATSPVILKCPLGLLAHATLAVGLVVLAFMTWVRVDLMGFLFGDILAINRTDIVIIWIGGLAVLAALALIWKSLFAATVNYEIAVAEGLKPDRANFFFMVLMAAVIAVSMKIVGVLLITALLIIPAATARRFAISPEMMAIVASMIGAASVWIGLEGSLRWDTPAGPSIVVAALISFILSLLPVQWLFKRLNFNRFMRG